MVDKLIKKILVIEDHPAMRYALQAGLEQEGYQVITASDGQIGLLLFYENPPDLVILDITMPVMDGWQVCQQIRQTSPVPIIILTGYFGSEDDIRRGLEIGANAYLVKPVTVEELRTQVKTALN
jgi:DNA-binding response OmpR family regulator